MEETVRDAVDFVIPIVDAIGAFIIVVGVFVAFATWGLSELRVRAVPYERVRLTLGRFLALAPASRGAAGQHAARQRPHPRRGAGNHDVIATERLSAAVVGPIATAVIGLAVLVFVVGAVRAPVRPRQVSSRLASSLTLTLELLLAAGLLRLATLQTWRDLGLVALVVAIRQVVSRGVRAAVRLERRSLVGGR